MKLPGPAALENAKANPARKYPDRTDARSVDGMLVPSLRPRFSFDLARPVFTIGSCFAREIEEVLLRQQVPLPTRDFMVPKEEWPYRPSGLLNEYNPGTMYQRIRAALTGATWPDATGVATERGVFDLLLALGPPVSPERFRQRRADIDRVYSHLGSAGLVVITLGLVEAWFDNETGHYLNRMPPPPAIRQRGKRFRFVRLGFPEVQELLEKSLALLVEHDPAMRILLTVSPVPLEATFTDADAVVANSYSKAVLRACATQMAERFAQVDYFPSYEMIVSAGPAALKPDNVHVTSEAVERVMGVLMSNYVDARA
jgi:hypothetical protein